MSSQRPQSSDVILPSRIVGKDLRSGQHRLSSVAADWTFVQVRLFDSGAFGDGDVAIDREVVEGVDAIAGLWPANF